MERRGEKWILAVFFIVLSTLACSLFETTAEKEGLESTLAAMQTELAAKEAGGEGTALPPGQPTSAETPIATFVETITAFTPTPKEGERGQFTLLGQVGGSAYAVAVEGSIAYLGQGPRLITLDVSQPSAPRLVGMSEVLPSVVQGVQVANGYAYVATRYNGLHILDVRDPARPTLVSSIRPKVAGCNSLVVREHLAYLACNPSGLFIVDVADPQQPRVLSTGQIKAPANSIAVIGPFAYLVDITNHGLAAVDVSDPSNPRQVGFFSAGNVPGSMPGASDFASVRVCGNRLCLAAYMDGLVVLDVSNPAQPAFVGRLDTSVASGLAASGDAVYLVDDQDGVYVLDVRNPGQPSQVGLLPTTVGGFEFTVHEFTERGVAVQGNLVFVTDPAYGLTLVDVSNGAPQRVGHYQTPVPDWLMEVSVVGEYAYVVGRNSGFRVLDVSDPSAPREVYYDDDRKDLYLQEPTGLVVEGGYAYISDANYPFHIYNVSDPQNPVEVGAVYDHAASDGAFDIVLYGQVAYLSGSGGPDAFYPGKGLWVVDISDPNQPKAVTFVDVPNEHWRLALHDHYLYAMDGAIDDKQAEPLSLRIFDLANPLKPVEVTKIPIPEVMPLVYTDILIDNGKLYLNISPQTLKIYDLANPIQPVEAATLNLVSGGNPKLEKEGNLLLLDSLVAYDLSDLNHPVLAGHARDVVETWDVDMVGDLVYVAVKFHGLYIFRYTP